MIPVPYILPVTGSARLKLDLNENPLLLPQAVVKCLTANDHASRIISMYPVEDEHHYALLSTIATMNNVTPDSILLTAGSDEALRLVADTYCRPKHKIFTPLPTYTYAIQWFIRQGGELVSTLEGADIAYLCTPNNPDGKLWSVEQITTVLTVQPATLVIVDEAYVEFGGVSVAALVGTHSNLIVTRTFSKAYGLAGLRIGYLLAGKQRMATLKILHNPKSVTQLAKQAALCALTIAKSEYDQQINTVLRAKQQFRNQLRLLDTSVIKVLTPEHSGGNFLFLQTPSVPDTVIRLHDEKGIAVRDRSCFVPNSFRITMGTDEQMKEVYHALCGLITRPQHPVRVLILAAGTGSRIKPFWNKHKCLLEINEETLLTRMCRQFQSAFGNRLVDITLVTGYNAEGLRIASAELNVNYVHNSQWQTTGNWRSMLCGLEALDQTVIALDGDLVVEHELVKRLSYLPIEQSLLTIDSTLPCDDEAMKAYTDGTGVIRLSKLPFDATLGGEFIGLTVVAPKDRLPLINELRYPRDTGEYYEDAWTRSIDRVRFRLFDTWGAAWFEIDTQADYERATTLFMGK